MSAQPRMVVSDTGPLISLEKLSAGFEFIHRLYDKILIPSAVLREVAEGQFAQPEHYLAHYGLRDWVEVREPSVPVTIPQSDRLHDAELEAIRLALELHLPLLIEEAIGRRVAESLGTPFSGIAGQIVKAFRSKVIDRQEAISKLSQLSDVGRINRKIFLALLQIVDSTN